MHKFLGEMLGILYQSFVVFFYYFACNLLPCHTHFPAGNRTHADWLVVSVLYRCWTLPLYSPHSFSCGPLQFLIHWFSCVLLDFRTFSSVLYASSGGFPESVSALYWPRLISYECLLIQVFPFVHLRFSSWISSDAIIKHTSFHQASATHEPGNTPFALRHSPITCVYFYQSKTYRFMYYNRFVDPAICPYFSLFLLFSLFPITIIVLKSGRFVSGYIFSLPDFWFDSFKFL